MGYTRVSTDDQNTDMPLDALRVACKGGRPKLSKKIIAALQAMWGGKKLSSTEIGGKLGIHRSTVFKYLKTDAKEQAHDPMQ